MTQTKMLNFAIQTAKGAGAILMEHFGKISSYEHKSTPIDLLTIADTQSEAFILNEIKTTFPDHHIIAEESAVVENNSDYRWVIDPLDGTTNFVHSLPIFAVSIGLQYKEETIVAVVYNPAADKCFWAEKNGGAFLNGKPLKVSRQKKLKGAFIAVADWYCFKQQKHISLFNALNKEAGIVRTYPDAFGHLMAICGTADVMVDPLAKIWDYAPCKVLAQEAGGKFANFTGNRASIEEGTAIVGNANIVKEVRKIFSKKATK